MLISAFQNSARNRCGKKYVCVISKKNKSANFGTLQRSFREERAGGLVKRPEAPLLYFARL